MAQHTSSRWVARVFPAAGRAGGNGGDPPRIYTRINKPVGLLARTTIKS
jgi:hypothetical protein